MSFQNGENRSTPGAGGVDIRRVMILKCYESRPPLKQGILR